MSENTPESFYCASNVTDVKVRTFIYMWKIRNFKFHVTNDRSKCLTSNTKFDNGQTLWSIKLCVNHCALHTTVTFDSNVAKLSSNCGSYFHVYIIKRDGKETEVFKKDNVICAATTVSIPFNLVSRDEVLSENSEWLRNGELMIKFKLSGATGDEITVPEPIFFDSCINNQSQCVGFDNIFNNKQFSDVKIVVDDKEFYVYKGILASRSPVFAAMFDHDMKENIENVVKVEDVKYETMQEMLLFMYTGKVNCIQSIAADLLAASDKYEMEDLKLICEKILINDLKVDTVTGSLVLADKYQAKNLKKYALEFFKLHMKEVVRDESYEKEMSSLLTIFPDIIKSLVL